MSCSDDGRSPPRPVQFLSTNGRFAARLRGLASGLALAVRPAGAAEVSGAQGWLPKIVSAKRSETIFGALDAGGADPDNTGRSGLIAVTFSRRLAALDARVTSWWWCWSARQRDTAGTAGGRSPGVPCAAVAAP